MSEDEDSGENPYKEIVEQQRWADQRREMLESMKATVGPGSYVDQRTFIVDWERFEFAIAGATLLATIFSFAGMEPVTAVGSGIGISFLIDGLYHRYRTADGEDI